ncbi:hypothetical protein KMP13_15660 [Epibacterium ulvae]|uniref:hypothetical protein n=1 Tax=Epibacterium ulvae TaxID=1156985 RepID=UPI001BFC9D5D|nr:hypothetical protein [Epibacterium ulvae]MBT8155277.1 hypothetical protein [Epibacterium ulvae]
MTLTLSGGALNFPVFPQGAGSDCHFAAPTGTDCEITRTVRVASEQKTLTTDHGRDQLTIYGDHGEIEFLDHGLRVASKMKEVWSIAHDDVTSAQAELHWDRSMSRGEFSASTRVSTTMHCDEHAFHITAHLKAYKGKDCVFERVFTDTVSRDPVKEPD